MAGIGCVYMVVNETFRIKVISGAICQIVRQLHLTERIWLYVFDTLPKSLRSIETSDTLETLRGIVDLR